MNSKRYGWVWTGIKVILLAALVGTICFIFSNSMKTASVSSSASGMVLAFLQKVLRRLGHPGLAARLTEHMVRKAAHFCEYMMEGFFLLLVTRMLAGRRRRLLPYLSWPALFGVLTALTDETIQLFIDGRGSLYTVDWIAFSGVVMGKKARLLFLGLWHLLFGRRRDDTEF